MKTGASHTSNGAIPPDDDSLAAQLRGFGPVGIAAIIIIILSGNIKFGNFAIPFGAVLVLVWAKWSRTPWQAIGFGRPKNWLVTLATGVVFGISFKLLMKAVVMPLLGAPPINQAYHYLAGNSAILPAAIWAMLNAGFSEETMFRGFMFERLGKLLGHRAVSKIIILLFTSAWFGLEHYSIQGIGGVEQSFIMGMLFGAIVLATRKLWMVMIAHAVFDLTALTIVYYNLESEVAHFIFK